mmetsp:Transcript_8143/g.25094  ORF Transcript_8143/g.25094 Transcript_8143/m.25094 type:complete len:257 (-) Transcript_8143:1009-1779(-)
MWVATRAQLGRADDGTALARRLGRARVGALGDGGGALRQPLAEGEHGQLGLVDHAGHLEVGGRVHRPAAACKTLDVDPAILEVHVLAQHAAHLALQRLVAAEDAQLVATVSQLAQDGVLGLVAEHLLLHRRGRHAAELVAQIHHIDGWGPGLLRLEGAQRWRQVALAEPPLRHLDGGRVRQVGHIRAAEAPGRLSLLGAQELQLVQQTAPLLVVELRKTCKRRAAATHRARARAQRVRRRPVGAHTLLERVLGGEG